MLSKSTKPIIRIRIPILDVVWNFNRAIKNKYEIPLVNVFKLAGEERAKVERRLLLGSPLHFAPLPTFFVNCSRITNPIASKLQDKLKFVRFLRSVAFLPARVPCSSTHRIIGDKMRVGLLTGWTLTGDGNLFKQQRSWNWFGSP